MTTRSHLQVTITARKDWDKGYLYRVSHWLTQQPLGDLHEVAIFVDVPC
jgi:hypothetical protein